MSLDVADDLEAAEDRCPPGYCRPTCGAEGWPTCDADGDDPHDETCGCPCHGLGPVLGCLVDEVDGAPLRCPYLDDTEGAAPGVLCSGTIVEVDVAVRWNPLTWAAPFPHLEGQMSPAGLVGDTGRQADFETSPDTPFICGRCQRPVTIPGDLASMIDYC